MSLQYVFHKKLLYALKNRRFLAKKVIFYHNSLLCQMIMINLFKGYLAKIKFGINSGQISILIKDWSIKNINFFGRNPIFAPRIN